MTEDEIKKMLKEIFAFGITNAEMMIKFGKTEMTIRRWRDGTGYPETQAEIEKLQRILNGLKSNEAKQNG